jgi:hypothetical protein
MMQKGDLKGWRWRGRDDERERTRRHTSAGGDALRPKQRLFYWRGFCQKENLKKIKSKKKWF